MQNAFYLHSRLIVICCLLAAGCVAGWIIYSFLFLPPSAEQDASQGVQTAVHAKSLEKVTSWMQSKAQAAAVLPAVPPSVFFIPPSL